MFANYLNTTFVPFGSWDFFFFKTIYLCFLGCHVIQIIICWLCSIVIPLQSLSWETILVAALWPSSAVIVLQVFNTLPGRISLWLCDTFVWDFILGKCACNVRSICSWSLSDMFSLLVVPSFSGSISFLHSFFFQAYRLVSFF